MRNKTTLAAVLAASLLGLGAAAHAQISTVVTIAPPAPRVEVVPAERHGHVWAPGHYEWRNRRHVWVNGHWIKARRGYAYNGPTWQERDGRWVMRQGQWVRGGRDNDGDGVPNRSDSRPNNPNRN